MEGLTDTIEQYDGVNIKIR